MSWSTPARKLFNRKVGKSQNDKHLGLDPRQSERFSGWKNFKLGRSPSATFNLDAASSLERGPRALVGL